ncbi:putative disease resistance protein-like [Capsicum annuum]|uniref:DUF1995 domain-containing protein n=1 Tax=Capsicum annuum TaxID=4072 RepID=A0A2G2YE62_CAPAN|nr:putative disease resistance protein-like [Capsicum annuum]PHT68037.1 hypothetical protein T459_27524 [Capsicum annuum]
MEKGSISYLPEKAYALFSVLMTGVMFCRAERLEFIPLFKSRIPIRLLFKLLLIGFAFASDLFLHYLFINAFYILEYFCTDVPQATQRAVNDGKTRLKIEISNLELNPAMDVYRIGTLMKLIRVLALSFADDGKRVKVCVQGSLGKGALAGMPLQLAESQKILEFMDWGDYDTLGTFVNSGSIGGKEVAGQDDLFILVAFQNAVENCIIDVIHPQYLPQNAGDIAQKYIRDPRLLSFIDVECFIVSTINALQSPISMQAWFYMRHFCGIN